MQARPASIALSKLRVPVPLALGKYELLSDLELKEAIADLNAERDRRIDERGYDFGLT